MKTTEVLLESIIGGALAIAAIVFILWGIIPDQMDRLFELTKTSKDLSVPLATAILTATAYAVGQIAEYGSLAYFEERRLTPIKRDRLQEFIRTHSASLARSATLAKLSPETIDAGTARQKVGQMRFEILHHGERLYAEIESQIRRMRLVRTLFFIEILAIIGVIPRIRIWPFGVVASCLFLLAALLWLTWKAVDHRFHMYCRSIERSYAILFLDPPLPAPPDVECP